MGTIAIPLGINLGDHRVRNNKRAVTALITGSASYATGGETIPAATFGLRVVDDVEISAARGGSTNSGASVRLAGTPQAPLLIFYDAANVEVTAATNLTSRQFIATFIGS